MDNEQVQAYYDALTWKIIAHLNTDADIKAVLPGKHVNPHGAKDKIFVVFNDGATVALRLNFLDCSNLPTPPSGDDLD